MSKTRTVITRIRQDHAARSAAFEAAIRKANERTPESLRSTLEAGYQSRFSQMEQQIAELRASLSDERAARIDRQRRAAEMEHWRDEALAERDDLIRKYEPERIGEDGTIQPAQTR